MRSLEKAGTCRLGGLAYELRGGEREGANIY